MHDPAHTPPPDHPPLPVEPDRSAPPQPLARQVKDGAFDDGSVAGEEDPGAGIETMVPKSNKAQR
jgi:hypothetical protein